MAKKKKDEKVQNSRLTPINSPLDIGRKNIEDLIKQNETKLSEANFLNSVSIPYTDDFKQPKESKFLIDVGNCIYSVTNIYKANSLTFKKITNFIYKDVKEVIRCENKSLGNVKYCKYYIATLLNENEAEVVVEITGDAKSDFKKFCSILDEKANGFLIECKKNEYREIFAKYISPEIACKIKTFTNAGVIGEKEFLYENAFIKDGNIKYADKDGYIQIDSKTFYKLDSKVSIAPKLATTIKSGGQIAKKFVENIIECWDDDYFLPLITIGHMLMSVFYKEFAKIGVPTLILYGESGTGKSTIEKCGLFIFGFSREAIVSGGSTVKSIEYKLSQYNSVIICVDDIKGITLLSGNFNEFIKSIYHATPRTKMTNYGREIEVLQVCSPFAGSTNERLPNLKEIINRLNIVEMFGKSFDSSKFNYFETNEDKVKELSLILPEILKFDIEEVKSIYSDTVKLLETSVKDTQRRVINNIAYAYTGVRLLLTVAGITLNDIEEKLIEYANAQVDKYEEVQDVVDKVLAEIPILYRLGQIDEGVLFTFSLHTDDYGNVENVVCFHKATMIAKINQCNAHDRSKYIDIDMFNAYCKTHPRYRGNKTVRYKDNINPNCIKDNSRNSVMFCIDGLDDYSFFHGVEPPELNGTIEQNGIKNTNPF